MAFGKKSDGKKSGSMGKGKGGFGKQGSFGKSEDSKFVKGPAAPIKGK